ncbi:MAG: O-antigen ligase family protein, partial [Blautia sp.]|nr:O-antigen ligase family protein [Blautia sp.]
MGSTLLHSGLHSQVWKCLKYIYPILGSVLLLESAALWDFRNAVKAVYYMAFSQTVINTCTVLLFENGIYLAEDTSRQYFLGNENLFIMTILLGLCAGCILTVEKGKRISWDYLVFLAASAVSILKVWSASSLIGMTVFLLGVLSMIVIPFDGLYRLETGIALSTAGFVSIVLLRMQYLFKPFIEGVLHKDVTLTLRTYLWDKVLNAVKKSPWIGYGVENAKDFNDRFQGSNMHWVHSHDYYLELLMKGGIVLLVLFLILLFVVAGSIAPYMAEVQARILCIAISAFLFCFIGDCYEMRTPFYMILTLAMAYGLPERKGGADDL